MSLKRITPITALALALVAIPPAAAGIAIDYDSAVDFGKYASYSWGQGTPAANPLNQRRIENAVNAQLQAVGLSPAEGTGDLIVVTHVSSDTELRITSDTFGYGGYAGWRGWGGGWGTTYTNVDRVPVGTLVIDLVDGPSQQLVWRGIITETVPSNPEKLERLIEKRVAKLFKNYPPD